MDKNELKKICIDMISNPPCCAELKAAGQRWLDAIGTVGEHEAALALIAELKEDVNTIDDTIGFFKSDFAREHFGADAERMLKEAVAAKESGAKWCTCPACQRGAMLLEASEILLS